MKPVYLLATAALAAALAAPAHAADCSIPVGVVMELTGPAGEYGQAGAKSVEMAFRDLNDAGGARGCKTGKAHEVFNGFSIRGVKCNPCGDLRLDFRTEEAQWSQGIHNLLQTALVRAVKLGRGHGKQEAPATDAAQQGICAGGGMEGPRHMPDQRLRAF